jgi:GTP-binding protein
MKSKFKQHSSVVIFGRTNVGKSTLFNKLTEKNQALVSKIEGTTRDSNIGTVNWRGKSFELIDTGGILDIKYLTSKKAKTDDIEEKVQVQAREMIKRADLILFMVDAISGLLPQDKQMALFLKKSISKANNIFLVVNKVDNQKLRKELTEFHKLSLGEPIPISSSTGSGTGDLLDIIVKKLPSKKEITDSQFQIPDSINVCILGQPNVGKSSLLNSMLGEDRVIVSPVPHTTREPQDTLINYKGQSVKLIDTAGISKKGKQQAYKKREKKYALEKLGIAKSLKSLDKSNIALFMVDISETITRQDLKIVEEIINRKKSLIIIANKWDRVKERSTKEYTQYLNSKLPFALWAPIQFTSALTGEKVKKVMDLILEINEQRKKEITDSQLNTFLMRIVKIHKPAKGKGLKHPHIHKFKQVKSNPPVFELRIGAKDDLHFSYVRFIENRLRDKFGFLGTPITIYVVKNKAIHGKHDG